MSGLETLELSEKQFDHISDLVRRLCGINLHDGKKELVRARLSKRLRQLGFADLDEYLQHVAQDDSGQELVMMLDALSTNLTYFFREDKHFDFLRQHALPEMVERHRQDRRLRIWSAGCSSGEEPYSIVITLKEAKAELASWDIGILATDLSTRMLKTAATGVYPPERLRQTPSGIVSKYFRCQRESAERRYHVAPEIRGMVHFARLNLMDPWPMRGPFDAIFCRNVMIYFDKPTQTRLVERFHDILLPGGFLFIGHSESLTGVRHRFQYVHPTVYRRS